jgi:methylase of polypeptide subunit release factors
LGLARRGLIVCGDWADALPGPFDAIVSNPPYVVRGEIARLAPEVRDHDPRLALDGGDDGLAAYREIIPALRDKLAPGGLIAMEMGACQHRAVESDLTSTDAGAWYWRILGSEPWRDKLVTLIIARDIFSQKLLAFAAKAIRFSLQGWVFAYIAWLRLALRSSVRANVRTK